MNNWYCNSPKHARGCANCVHNPQNMTPQQITAKRPLVVTIQRNRECHQYTGIIKPIEVK